MYLNNYSFYEKLNTEALEFLEKSLMPVSLKKGNILFYQDDICDNILFLTKGKVRLYIQSDDAEEITLYELSAGEQCIVNTASTISQTQAIGSAVTTSDIEGYLISAKNAKILAKMSDDYQSFLFSLYTLRMRDLAQLVNDIKFKKLPERVLEWLNSKKISKVQTTHETIANELGSSRVATSRVLKELEKSNKISLSRGYIEIL